MQTWFLNLPFFIQGKRFYFNCMTHEIAVLYFKYHPRKTPYISYRHRNGPFAASFCRHVSSVHLKMTLYHWKQMFLPLYHLIHCITALHHCSKISYFQLFVSRERGWVCDLEQSMFLHFLPGLNAPIDSHDCADLTLEDITLYPLTQKIVLTPVMVHFSW